MFRPQVFFVRLIILSLAVLSLWLSAPGWLQPLVRYQVQRAFGTAIDFDRCQLDWNRHGIELQNVQIADPHDPLRNLVQASSAWLEFDPASLWTRQWKIEKVRWNEDVLGSPREKLAGDRLNGATFGSNYPSGPRLNYDLNVAAKRWLDQVQSLPPVDQGASAAEFASASKIIRATWENDFKQHRETTEEIGAQISALQSELKRSGRNPLRLAEEEKAALAQLRQLEGQLDQSRQWLSNWPEVQAQAISRLAANREKGVPAQLSSSRFNANTKAASEALLVSEVDLQTAQQVVDWCLTLNRRLASLQATSNRPGQRGKTIPIRGVEPIPGLVISDFQFTGGLHTPDGHIDFAGNVQPLADHPQLLEQPLQFQLRGQGKSPFQIEGTLAFQSSTPVQTMRIEFLPTTVATAELGTASSVLITTSSHRMQAEAVLEITADQIEGEIICYHSQLGLFVNALNDIAGGQNVQEKLNRHLSTIKNIEVVAKVSGTVAAPEITFSSNLGESFTPALAECLNEAHYQRQTYDQALIEQTFETVIKSLTDYSESEVASLTELLQKEQVRLSELDQRMPANGLRYR